MSEFTIVAGNNKHISGREERSLLTHGHQPSAAKPRQRTHAIQENHVPSDTTSQAPDGERYC